MIQEGHARELLGAIDVIRTYLRQEQPATPLTPPESLQRLTKAFHLDTFEQHVLLLCLGMELDPSFPALCAAAQGDPERGYPTFQMALSALPGSSWAATTPTGSLRYYQLVNMAPSPVLLRSPLSLPERIMHFLCGLDGLDIKLVPYLELLHPPKDAAPSHQEVAGRLAQLISKAAESPKRPPIFQLQGSDTSDRRRIAALAGAMLQASVYAVNVGRLPQDLEHIAEFIQIWRRESLLGVKLLYLETPVETEWTHRIIDRIADEFAGVLMIGSVERRTIGARPLVHLTVDRPTVAEQRHLWMEALGDEAARLEAQITALVSQFRLDNASIRAAVAASYDAQADPETIGRQLWDYCRSQTQPKLSALAHHIQPMATMADLVLPEDQMTILEDVVNQVKLRAKVYEDWGFDQKSHRGLGVSVLFHGPSGTGKTLAAEILAAQLNLDLYRIDLSSVISKYIGETEKNLREIFDAAESGGAILLFDEADAIFGKRSEVKDSHDRHANIEVAYLLQRMEQFRGLAILTTNLKDSIDQAFMRRIRFVVKFPFPDAAQRAEIWSRIFPEQSPIGEFDTNKLSKLNLTGGNIRNIALNAAFLAAGDDDHITMAHIIKAAEHEYAKLERMMLEIDD